MSEEETVRRASVQIQLDSVEISAHAKSRSDFAITHMLTSARHSRAVRSSEDQNDSDAVLQLTISSVISASVALEAYANELFFEPEQKFSSHDSKIIKLLWSKLERDQPLEKFEVASILLDAPRIDKSRSPYQDVKSLIILRNALMHFKSEWSDANTNHGRISSLLHGKYTPKNGMPIDFTSNWAGHSCTRWAVTRSLEFIGEFENSAGLEDTFGKFSHLLQP